jgi:hypothetical protein
MSWIYYKICKKRSHIHSLRQRIKISINILPQRTAMNSFMDVQVCLFFAQTIIPHVPWAPYYSFDPTAFRSDLSHMPCSRFTSAHTLEQKCLGTRVLYLSDNYIIRGSRDSVVGIGLRVGRPRGRSSSPGRVKNFLFTISSRPALRFTQPPIQWVPAALSRVKRPGCEADHSPPTSAEVKKMWIYTATSPYVFMA